VIDFHLGLEFAIRALAQHIEQVAALAIAHDLEHLYEPPPEAPGKTGRSPRKKG